MASFMDSQANSDRLIASLMGYWQATWTSGESHGLEIRQGDYHQLKDNWPVKLTHGQTCGLQGQVRWTVQQPHDLMASQPD